MVGKHGGTGGRTHRATRNGGTVIGSMSSEEGREKGTDVLDDDARRLIVDALGTQVVIDFASTVPVEIVAAAEHAWSDAAAHGSPLPNTPVVAVSTASLETTLSDLPTRVALAALDDVKGTALLFHACGVALPDGRVVAFVGPSGRGKTTAARMLGGAYGYVSDESIAVRAGGEVLPYRKPLSVIDPSQPTKRQIPPSAAGLLGLPERPLTLSALVLLERRADAERVLISEVPLLDAMLALIPQMSYLASLDRPLQTLAQAIARVGGVAQVTYAEAENIRDTIEHLARRTRIAPSWQECTDHPTAVPVGRVGRAKVSDAIELDDGSIIVMSDSTIRVLDGIAPVLWLTAIRPQTREELRDAVVAVHGAPGSADPAPLVDRAIDELVEAGLLHAP